MAGNRLKNAHPMVLIILTMVCYSVGQLLIPVLLFYFSSDLGVWWFILLIIYIALWLTGISLLWRRKEMRAMRATYGEDFFYKAYPREKKREERRKAREERKSLQKK